VRAWLAIVTLLVGLLVAANAMLSTPAEPPLLIDEPDQTGVLPAQLTMPTVMMCRPVLIGPPPTSQITRT
jgi:hypothetical protein